MIEDIYKQLCATPSDINEHLPTLKKYAEQSDFIVELGVRSIVSTWALLAGKPKQMLSVDITHPKDYGADIFPVYDMTAAEGIDWHFTQQSSLDIQLPPHDFLFIDTIHTKEHLSQELVKHADMAKKFIGFHDTHIAGLDEMMECINEFLATHPEWQIEEDYTNNNGLTILKRV